MKDYKGKFNILFHCTPYQSFLSNTVPVQVDLEYWSCVWPEMPIHGVHYWSTQNVDFLGSAKALLNLTDLELDAIAETGRKWVLENYSPLPVAKRLLKYVEEIAV